MSKEFYAFKIKLFCKFFQHLFTGIKCLPKHHIKHSLSLFRILMILSIGFLIYVDNGKQELPTQGATSEIKI